MTPLQVIRHALQAGATLTMYRLPDGVYRVHVATLNEDGNVIMIELDESRLDQAIHRITEHIPTPART